MTFKIYYLTDNEPYHIKIRINRNALNAVKKLFHLLYGQVAKLHYMAGTVVLLASAKLNDLTSVKEISFPIGKYKITLILEEE